MLQKELLWVPGRLTSNGKRAIHSNLRKKIGLLLSKESRLYTAKRLYACDSMARFGGSSLLTLLHRYSRITRYMSYVWNNSVGKHEDAVNILKEGIKANPARLVWRPSQCVWRLIFISFASFLLNFAYAEVLEAKKDKDGVFAVFDKFTDVLRADLEALEARINSANSSFESNGSTKTLPVEAPAVSAPSVVATGLTEAGLQSNNSSFNTQSSDERPPKSKELADKRTEYGLVWIMYMRAARRVESQQTARALFGRCRKDRWIPWEVYEASGLSNSGLMGLKLHF
jgi:cleavage stimulation factor subunit 3